MYRWQAPEEALGQLLGPTGNAHGPGTPYSQGQSPFPPSQSPAHDLRVSDILFIMPHGCTAILTLVLGPALLGLTNNPSPTQTDDPATPPARIIVAPAATPTLDPVRPNLPPTAAADLELGTNPPLMREGAFISSARAQLVRGKSGRLYAIFDADAQGRRLPPMIMGESPHLAAIERLLEREPSGARVRLFGRVTVYRDRNFLIPTAPAMQERFNVDGSESPATPSTPPTPPAQPAATDSQNTKAMSTPSDDPSIEQIVAELDKAVGSRRIVPAAPGQPASAPAGVGPLPVTEGADAGVTSGFLTTRRARVTRLPDGQLAATLDSGTDGRTDGPLLLLPNQNLTALESIAEQLGDGVTYTLTGDVYVYKSRRYLLTSMYAVNRASDSVFPMQ